MGYYIAFPLLALIVALQSSVIPQVRVAGVQPDLVFLIVVLWSANAELEEGVFWAFVGGIMQDLLSITPIGTSTIAMLGAVFAVNLISRQLYRVNLILVMGIITIGTVVYHFVIQFVLTLNGLGLSFFEILTQIVAPTLVYNLVLVIPIYVFLRRIQKRIPKSGPQFVA